MVSLLLALLGFAAAQSTIAPDDGTFIYSKDGKEIGQEKFVVRASGNANSTTTIDSAKESATYDFTLSSRSGKLASLDAVVAEKRSTGTVRNDARAVQQGNSISLTLSGRSAPAIDAPIGAYLFHRRFLAGLYMISAAYDRNKAGKQTLPVFNGDSFKLTMATVTDLGPETLRTRAGPKAVRHYQMTLGGPAVDWYERSDERHIVFIQNNITGEVAYRPEFEPEEAAPTEVIVLPNRDKYDDLAVVVPSYRVNLSGSLFIPKTEGQHPGVVIINGMGQQDRDGDTVDQPKTHLCAILADRLAAAGYEVLRWDDRGVGRGPGNANDITLKVDKFDALAMLDWLRSRPDVDPNRIVAVGVDTGGVIASMATQEDWWLAGIVLLAVPSEPIDKVLVEGLTRRSTWEAVPSAERKSAASQLVQVKKAIALAKQGKPFTGLPFNVGWLREHMATDPVATIKKVTVPVLVVQPGADLTVLPRHGERLKNILTSAGNKEVTYVVLPGDTHGFTPSPYKNPKYSAAKARDIDMGLPDLLIRWLGKHLPAK